MAQKKSLPSERFPKEAQGGAVDKLCGDLEAISCVLLVKIRYTHQCQVIVYLIKKAFRVHTHFTCIILYTHIRLKTIAVDYLLGGFGGFLRKRSIVKSLLKHIVLSVMPKSSSRGVRASSSIRREHLGVFGWDSCIVMISDGGVRAIGGTGATS